MFSSITLSRPLIISLAVVSTIGVVSAAFFQFSGTAGTSHSPGTFKTDGTTGNAGTVSFDTASPCNIPASEIAGLNNQNLTGKFCLETV